jgi:hypothetical protein
MRDISPCITMKTENCSLEKSTSRKNHSCLLERRAFLTTTATAAVGALVAPVLSAAERDWTSKTPVRYPDADII